MSHKIKQYISYLLIILVSLSLTACSINIKGSSQVNDDPVFNSEEIEKILEDDYTKESTEISKPIEEKDDSTVIEKKDKNKDKEKVSDKDTGIVVDTKIDDNNEDNQQDKNNIDNPKNDSENEEIEPIKDNDPEVIVKDDNPIYNMGSRYYLSQLSKDQLEIAKTIYKGLINFDNTIYIPNSIRVSNEEMNNIVNAVIFDCPELFMIDGSYTLIGNKTCSAIKFDYVINHSTYKSQAEKLSSFLTKIKGLTEGKTDYEKEIYAHNKLLGLITYTDNTAYGYTAYEAIFSGKAVCQGYAKAFQLIMQYLDIPCLYVTSEEINHAWNLVKIDDSFYQVDVTWDDTGSDNNYYFFNLTDYQMASLNHSYETNNVFTYPSCDNLTYNWYVLNGLYVKEGTDVKSLYIDLVDNIYYNNATKIKLMFENSSMLERVMDNYLDWLNEWNLSHNINFRIETYKIKDCDIIYEASIIF